MFYGGSDAPILVPACPFEAGRTPDLARFMTYRVKSCIQVMRFPKNLGKLIVRTAVEAEAHDLQAKNFFSGHRLPKISWEIYRTAGG